MCRDSSDFLADLQAYRPVTWVRLT